MEVDQVENFDWAKDKEDEDEEKLKLEMNLKSNENKRKRQTSDSQLRDDKKRYNGPKRSSEDALDRIETDPAVLERRQKTIDYGKNTVGYTNYRKQVPIEKRTKVQPRTPDKYYKYSRRSWDQLIKTWRKQLHLYDPKSADAMKKYSENTNHDSKVIKKEFKIKNELGTIKSDPETSDSKITIKHEPGCKQIEAATVKTEENYKSEPQPLIEFDYRDDSDDYSS